MTDRRISGPRCRLTAGLSTAVLQLNFPLWFSSHESTLSLVCPLSIVSIPPSHSLPVRRRPPPDFKLCCVEAAPPRTWLQRPLQASYLRLLLPQFGTGTAGPNSQVVREQMSVLIRSESAPGRIITGTILEEPYSRFPFAESVTQVYCLQPRSRPQIEKPL